MAAHQPSAAWRLFLTVWLVYCAFATTNVVRETYLAISLGTRLSLRVDPYRDLHPDLFEFPGRGWFINSNPGTSLVGAGPYAVLVRPLIALAVKLRPDIAAHKPPATYDDPRPNRTRFMNAARARGLDITLGLAALGTAATVMAPLGALSALLMFLYLRARLDDERNAVGLALVFAFATPMLFRAAFLNQNVLVAHLVFGAWILKSGLSPHPPGATPAWRTLVLTGLVLGFALVCDFSAIPFVLTFGLWILIEGWRRSGVGGAWRDASVFSGAVLCAVSVLFAYQWAAFGHPLWPAQRYMPPTEFSVRGWLGFTAPTLELLLGNLFDLRYGLFAFCPLLLLAAGAPFIRRSRQTVLAQGEMPWMGLAFIALLLFSSAIQFANLQWNTGVRYMVPVVPLLFLAAVPMLQSIPRVVLWLFVGSALLISLAVSMTREGIPIAVRLLLTEGPTLPVLTVLRKMASGYSLPLPPGTFWIIALTLSAILFLVWRPWWRRGVA